MISYILSRIMNRITIKTIFKSTIHETAKLQGIVKVSNSSMGKYSYMGTRSSLTNTEVGAFCSISTDCTIGVAAHPIDWVSSSPVFHSGKNILNTNFSEHQFNPRLNTKIGNDVWIGSHVLIKSGVKIGNGVIIGMGSIVTKDIPDYEIWAGNPAKKIRDRFDEKTKKRLLDSKWWDLSEKDLKGLGKYVNNVPQFLEEVEKII